MTRVLGVDGDKKGWIGVVLADGDFHGAGLATTIDELVADIGEVDAIAVDMPIGWCERERIADGAARGRLPGKASSIFNSPVAAVREASDYHEANRLSYEAVGKGLSRQSWALVPKIREVTRFAGTSTVPVVESHPELSFAELNRGKPVLQSKYTWNGHRARLGLLGHAGVLIPDDLGEAGVAGTPDVLDAAAVAWTSHRVAIGAAHRVSEERQFADDGLEIAIWV